MDVVITKIKKLTCFGTNTKCLSTLHYFVDSGTILLKIVLKTKIIQYPGTYAH